MKKPRRDVLKSQEAIKQAFIQLCIAHDTSKITVNQILELADVSRGTFYAHFQDVYDVRRQLEDDLLKYCLDLLQQDDIYSIAQNPYPQILKVAHFFAEHADAIKISPAAQTASICRSTKRFSSTTKTPFICWMSASSAPSSTAATKWSPMASSPPKMPKPSPKPSANSSPKA